MWNTVWKRKQGHQEIGTKTGRLKGTNEVDEGFVGLTSLFMIKIFIAFVGEMILFILAFNFWSCYKYSWFEMLNTIIWENVFFFMGTFPYFLQ